MPTSLSLDEALEKNPVGLFQYRLLLMCGFAFMTDGLEVNLLTFLATCAGDEWGLSDQEQAAITGYYFKGWLHSGRSELLCSYYRGSLCWHPCRFPVLGPVCR
jgi:hypothetical protein